MRERRYRRSRTRPRRRLVLGAPTGRRGANARDDITIDRDHREGLYEVVRNHLAVIEDFWVAMEQTRDFKTAEQLGLELAEDFRLLRDVGWGKTATARPSS